MPVCLAVSLTTLALPRLLSPRAANSINVFKLSTTLSEVAYDSLVLYSITLDCELLLF